jgi:hypothetical protein
MLGLPESFEVVHYNGPVFTVLDEPDVEGASLAEGLAAFEGCGDRFTPAEQFAGEPAGSESILLKRAAAAGAFSAVAGELGVGRVVAFGSHPEFGFDLAMVEWGAPARMLVNAALWQAAAPAPRGAVAWSYREQPGPIALPRGSAFALVQDQATALVSDITQLRMMEIDPVPTWLTGPYAMSVFGLSPAEIWTQSLDDIERFASNISEMAGSLRESASALGTSDDEREALAQIERWLLDERPAAWRQDGGYHGVAALLRTAHEMCESAIAQWNVELGPPAGPYAYFHENPFHLVAGSYLAAVGYAGGALQLMRALTAELDLVHRMRAGALDEVAAMNG